MFIWQDFIKTPHITTKTYFRRKGLFASKIGMFKAVLKAIEETAVTDAVAWKALDVYDTIKQEGIAHADRVVEDALFYAQLDQNECHHKEKWHRKRRRIIN